MRKVGTISQKVIDKLGIPLTPGTPINLGPTNIEHMQREHPTDFEKYYCELENILANPHYVIPDPKQGSLQYIRILDAHVMVVVRVSGKGVYFSRSIYKMGSEKVERWERMGLFEKYQIE